MFELGNYGESDNKFIKDQEEIVRKVIVEINNRLKNN